MTSDNLIAFSDNGIWVADLDGGDRRRLAGRGECPEWSPDGSYISYAVFSDEEQGIWPLFESWVVSPDGARRYRLTKDCVGDFWSPDGRHIAYIARRNRQYDIGRLYVAAADGSQRTYISESLFHNLQWSPDGSRLTYVKPVGDDSDDSAFREEIWMVRADGSEPRRLSRDGSGHSWSPDGKLILYSCCFEDDTQIGGELWVEEATGGNRRMLDRSAIDRPRIKCLLPGGWSGDGKRILYSSVIYEDFPDPASSEIWVTGRDGTGRRKLADGDMPVWETESGTMVLFSTYAENNAGEEGFEMWEVDADEDDPRPRRPEPPAFPGVPPVPGRAVRVSPDGQRAIYGLPQEAAAGGLRMELWTAEEDGNHALLTEHGFDTRFFHCQWSPDSRYVTYAVILHDGQGRVAEEQAWVASADDSRRFMLSASYADMEWRPAPQAPAGGTEPV